MRRATAGERLARMYAKTVVALRVLVVAAWIVAAVAAWVLLPSLGGSSTAPLGDIVPADSSAVGAQERALRLFGSTVGTDIAIVQRNPRGLTSQEVEAHVRAAQAVRGRRAPAGFEGVRAALPLPNADIPGIAWGERGTAVISYLFLGPELNLVERDAVAHRYATLLRAEPGSSIGVTGAGAARLEQFRTIESALPWVTIATVLLIVLICAAYFRSLGAPLVTLLTAAVAYVVAVRALAWAGERAGVTAPSEIEPVLVVLLLGLVTDYTVFFLAETRRRLLDGDARVPAARAATVRIAPIVFTAGVVVAGGALALLAGRMEFFRVFGPGLALSALVVTLVCVTFVPAILGLFGERLFGRRVREASGRVERTGSGAIVLDAGGPSSARPRSVARRERWRMRMSGPLGTLRASRSHARSSGGRVLPAFIARVLAVRPVAFAIVVGSVLALALAASGGRGADLAVSFIPSLPSDNDARRAAADAGRAFGPGVLAPTDIVLEQPGVGGRLPELVSLQRLLARERGVAAVIGPSQPAGTPLEDAVIARSGDAARYAVVLDAEPTSAEAIDVLGRLESRMPSLLEQARLPPGARLSYAGETALAVETVDSITGDLRRVAVATVLVTFLLLAIFLRALVAPLLLVAASALAFCASFGLAALVIDWLLGGADFIYYVPLVAGVLLIGLGSDYNVFIAGRIREEVRTRRLREAIAIGAPAASRAISVAGITLAASFALLALVPLRPFRELAILMTIGVLVDALFVRPVLIPALIAVAGRSSWWPGRPHRPPRTTAVVERVAERTGLSGADADRLTVATLATLGERIPERQAREVGRQLPRPLALALEEPGGVCSPFPSDEFVARVARRTGSSTAEAREDAAAVMATVMEILPQTEIDYVRASLSKDYRWLFGDAVGLPPDPEEQRPAVLPQSK